MRLHRHPGLIVLALAALWMQVLVPQGFMVSSAGGGANAGPALVICTGHGPLQLAGHSGKAPKPTNGAPCAFAAHGATTTPPTPVPVAVLLPTITEAATGWAASVSPGLGLAAPPPQSHAPPVVSI